MTDKIMADKTDLLRFGIPSLDVLIGTVNPILTPDPIKNYGLQLHEGSSNICIVGTAGTGKSILALHLASRYLADCAGQTGDPAKGPKAPCVFFVSTDLDANRAKKLWDDDGFGLNKPNERKIPFSLSANLQEEDAERQVGKSFFVHQYPANVKDLSLPFNLLRANSNVDENGAITTKSEEEVIRIYIEKPDGVKLNQEPLNGLGFIDLHSQTKGDDWAFVNRLLATIPKATANQNKHLMVIDAVEGLDLLGGEYDAFGERRPRESRITQLIRSAAGKCHLLFIVEQPTEAHRLAEIFSADLLLHLKQETHHGYSHRTLQIIKARGQSHISGIHLYDIRDRNASLTGETPNPDQPHWKHSYVHVFHGMDALSHLIALRKGKVETHGTDRPTFGIRYLDAMLGYNLEDDPQNESVANRPPRNVTALIGNMGTYKSTLGYAFLSECFEGSSKFPLYKTKEAQNEWNVGILLTTQLLDDRLLSSHIKSLLNIDDFFQIDDLTDVREFILTLKNSSNALSVYLRESFSPELKDSILRYQDSVPPDSLFQEDLVKGLNELIKGESLFHIAPCKPDSKSERAKELFAKYPNLDDLIDKNEHKILLNRFFLRAAFGNHLKEIEEWLICRRLPVQAATTAEFFHIVESAIWEARSRMAAKLPSSDDFKPEERFRPNDYRDRWQGTKDCPRIRLVIDDWSVIKSNYPDVNQHPEFLEFLKQYLKWQGITTLIIETQAGTPTSGMRVENERDCHIYTWKVSFYNEERVAIAVQPPPPSSSSLKATVRELKRREDISGEETDGQKPEVDPHFEYYSGLEKGEPHPLPLKVCLFAGSSGSSEYLDETEALLRRFFTGVKGSDIVEKETAENYEDLRLLALSPHKQRLDYTQIVQVDEFWQHSDDVPPKSKAANSAIQKRNSEGATFCEAYLNARTIDKDGKPTPEDPFRLFQPSEATEERNREENKRGTPELQKAFVNRRRHSFFPFKGSYYQRNDSYESGKEKSTEEMDAGPRSGLSTVPMMWDFGFLHCRRRSWMSAKDRPFTSLQKNNLKVRDVINWLEFHSLELPDTQTAQISDLKIKGNLTWFDFFQACRLVAQTQLRHGEKSPVYAFDFDMSSTEGLSCVILEIMATELRTMLSDPLQLKDSVYQALDYREAKLLFRLHFASPYRDQKTISGDKNGLLDLFKNPICQEALLRAMLLVFGVTEASQFEFPNFNRQERPAYKEAVAARQWYSTASRAMEHWVASDPLVPWRLPGCYSVRGDWFLTIADGSQSTQLAKGALDLLSSRRANLARLKLGVGLPTRSMWSLDHQRTKLFTIRHSLEMPDLEPVSDGVERIERPLHQRRMRYGEIKALGVKSNDNSLQWLWRSHMRHYQRHSRIWNRWLLNFARNWQRREVSPDLEDLDAHELYRLLVDGTVKLISQEAAADKINIMKERESAKRIAGRQSPDWKMTLVSYFFHEAVNRLVKDLQSATPLDPETKRTLSVNSSGQEEPKVKKTTAPKLPDSAAISEGGEPPSQL